MKENKNEIKETALGNKCPSCSASISFDPKHQKWKCSYCGSIFTIDEMKRFENAANEKNNQKKETSKEEDNSQLVKYHCDSCGAEIVADEQTSATFCVYCGNATILKSKLDGVFAPEKIIPFSKTKEDAVNAFKSLNKGRPLMPKFFNKESNIEKIKGVYIPFWLYDVEVSGNIIYEVTQVKTWTVGNTTYTKTDKYKKTRGGSMKFNRIPVDASTRFNNDIMSSLEPFNFDEFKDYNHAYLSGFYAERYDESGDENFKDARDRALETAKDTIMEDRQIYESVNIKENNLTPKIIKTTYVLLPVWMVNIKFNNKLHTFAMNGQTGEFIGNIPTDKKKAVIYFLLVLIIVSVLAYFLIIGR